jgi:hypothetical protein
VFEILKRDREGLPQNLFDRPEPDKIAVGWLRCETAAAANALRLAIDRLVFDIDRGIAVGRR